MTAKFTLNETKKNTLWVLIDELIFLPNEYYLMVQWYKKTGFIATAEFSFLSIFIIFFIGVFLASA
jgi:hypothetical protein